MAEAIARKEASDVIEAASAGIFPLGMICESTLAVLDVNEYPAAGLNSKGLREFAPDDVDLVINMSGLRGALAEAGYPLVEHWDVEDPYGQDEDTYQRILEAIRGRVRDLAERLREDQPAASKRN